MTIDRLAAQGPITNQLLSTTIKWVLPSQLRATPPPPLPLSFRKTHVCLYSRRSGTLVLFPICRCTIFLHSSRWHKSIIDCLLAIGISRCTHRAPWVQQLGGWRMLRVCISSTRPELLSWHATETRQIATHFLSSWTIAQTWPLRIVLIHAPPPGTSEQALSQRHSAVRFLFSPLGRTCR